MQFCYVVDIRDHLENITGGWRLLMGNTLGMTQISPFVGGGSGHTYSANSQREVPDSTNPWRGHSDFVKC